MLNNKNFSKRIIKKKLIIILVFMSKNLISMEQRQQWNPTEYEKNALIKIGKAQNLFSQVSLRGNERIVDVGCGTGLITAYMAKKTTGKVVGIDSSRDMIEYAQSEYKDIQNLTFLHQSAETITEFDIDIITAFSVLHWIKEPHKLMYKIVRCLKNDGFFIATIAYKSKEPDELLEAVQKAVVSERWSEIFRNENTIDECFFPLNEQTIARILPSTLKKIKLAMQREKQTFKTKNDFVNWLDSWVWAFSFLHVISEREKNNFLEDVIDRYTFSKTKANKNPLEYETTMIHLIFQKNIEYK